MRRSRLARGNGTYDSGPYTATVSGVYKFRATYSGDVNHFVSGPTPCLDPNESVAVIAAPTLVTLTTTASPAVVVGGTIADTATLAGGTNPTGTVTFNLFGPDDATCAGTPSFTSTKTAAATVTSASFVPTAPGVYRWVASYSGDANNAALTTACNVPNESVVVVAAPPSPPSIRIDGTADSLTLPEPGGTFTGRVSVTNTGTETVTLIALADEDLNGVGTCSVPQTLMPGATYSCPSRSCSRATPTTPRPSESRRRWSTPPAASSSRPTPSFSPSPTSCRR